MNGPMTPINESNLCGKCGARLGANHICYGSTGESVVLCDECLRADESMAGMFAARLADEAKSARCCYCGGFPCGGGPDTFSQITGGPSQNRWMCMSCTTEYYSYSQNAFESFSGDLTLDEQIAGIKEVGADADAHMAAFVRNRYI